jgi:putative membrane protein
MKTLARNYIIATASLYLSSQIASGLVFERGIITILLAGAGIALALMLVKPIINVLLLPINLITFGLFRWLSSAIAIYLVTLIVPGFRVSYFLFNGFSSSWFDFPKLSFEGVVAIIAFSFVISVFTTILHWIIK